MVITVALLGSLPAVPGRAKIPSASELSGTSALLRGGRPIAPLFQDVDDCCRYLCLATWESREAFHEQQGDLSSLGRAEFAADPAEALFFRRLLSFENMSRRVESQCCTILRTDPRDTLAVLTHLTERGQRLYETDPTLVSYGIYEDLDVPGRLLVLQSWAAPAQAERRRELGGALLRDSSSWRWLEPPRRFIGQP